MNAIGTAIQEVEQRIQQLQELHASLVKAVPLLFSVIPTTKQPLRPSMWASRPKTRTHPRLLPLQFGDGKQGVRLSFYHAPDLEISDARGRQAVGCHLHRHRRRQGMVYPLTA